MAEPTAVNSQITDAVTQANVKVVGEAPAMAMANVYQTAAHSLGLMFENAVNAQGQQNILAQAATTQAVVMMYRAAGLTPPAPMFTPEPPPPSEAPVEPGVTTAET
jgi:hypothetical protein